MAPGKLFDLAGDAFIALAADANTGRPFHGSAFAHRVLPRPG